MEKIISPKTKKKLDIILELKTQIENWKSYKEEELFQIVKEFEKKPRDEVSFWYDEALSDKTLAKTLLAIADKHPENIKMNQCIISTLGYMITRYKLESSEEIFNYFLKSSEIKSLALNVSYFLP
ncbi:hypothetical protein, partial [Sphingobacterium sp. ML3W]|uniref:hypothetical protein n=1 Tax=Sphingobacterium sp. ML3W TaxID=1538644 RepID=UPI00056EAEF2